MDRLRDEHQAASDVARREDVWRGGSEVFIDSYIATRIGLDACRDQVETCSVGGPANRYHRECGFGTISRTVFREDHSHTIRRFLEYLDGSKALAHHHARFTEGCRHRGGHVFVLGGQDARTGFKELDP